jgi:Peroxidase
MHFSSEHSLSMPSGAWLVFNRAGLYLRRHFYDIAHAPLCINGPLTHSTIAWPTSWRHSTACNTSSQAAVEVQIGRIPGVSSSNFDNDYYQSLLRGEGGLGSDRTLLLEPARALVEEYANADSGNAKFLKDFRNAYVKLTSFGYA